MTFDLQLRQRCPHLAVQAPATLSRDRRTILLPYEIGRFGIVRVYANGFDIPSAGLYSSPSLLTASAGPFAIPPSLAKLMIQTSSGEEEVVVPSGSAVSQQAVLASLVNSTLATFSQSGNLISVVPKSQTDTFIRISGPSASLIGFRAKGSQSRLVYPGWNLVSTQSNGVTTKVVRFKSDLMSNPNIRVTYPFEPSKCPRCLSAQIENDISFNDDGTLAVVRDETLLLQESLKILLTELGSNPYHTWYGTRIRQRIGKKNVSDTAALLQEDVRAALDRYKDLQTQQSQYQNVTAKQRISSIDSINVSSIQGLPTAFELTLIVRNASNQPITITSVFTVPGVQNTLTQGT